MRHIEDDQGRTVMIGWDEHNHVWYIESTDPVYVRSFAHGKDLNAFLAEQGFRYINDSLDDQDPGSHRVDWSRLLTLGESSASAIEAVPVPTTLAPTVTPPEPPPVDESDEIRPGWDDESGSYF